MYLKRIILHGFKSFADRTELEFRPGITAIVGPNGGGKSNITDGLRFCLGEQNSRVLRGSRLEDLIFSGSAKRGPFSLAEVSMIMDNSDEDLPLDFNEISITRRIYRDDTSQHFINKNACRLKDIQELFIGTGMGQGGLSFLSQEEVNMVLSDSQTRRNIIEEIAGTNKYKFRKKEALRKLEHTDNNLKRLIDILYEVQSQLSSLEKQVKKYRRYKRAREKLWELEKNYSFWQINLFKTQLEPLNKEEEQLSLEKSEVEKNANILKEGAREIELQLYKKDTEINDFLQNLSQQQIRLQSHLNFLELIKEREENSHRSLKEAGEEIESAHVKLEKLKNDSDENQKELIEIRKSREEAEKLLLLQEETLDEFIKKQDEACPAQEEYFKVYQKLAELKSDKNFLENKIEHIQKNIQRLKENNGKNIGEEKTLLGKTQGLSMALGALEEKQISLHAELEHSSSDLNLAESSLRKKTQEIMPLQESLYKKIAQLNALQKLEGEMNELSCGVKSILKNKENFPGLKDTISNLLHIPDEYKAAIDTIIGKHFEDMVVSTLAEAIQYIEYLKGSNLGRVTFWVQNNLKQTSSAETKLDFDGIIGMAKDIVSYAPKYADLFGVLLGNTILVKDLEAAKNIAQKLKERNLTPPKIATTDGDIIDPSGAVTGGSRTNAAATLLNRREKIHWLKEEIASLEAEIQNAEKQKKSLEERIEHLAEKNMGLKKCKDETCDKIKQIQGEITKNNGELTNILISLQKNQHAIYALGNELENIMWQKGGNENLILENTKKCDQLSIEFERFQTKQQEIYKNLEEIRSICQDYKIKLAELSGKEKNLIEKEKFYSAQINETKSKIKTLENYSIELENKIKENQLNKEKTDKLILDVREGLASSENQKSIFLKEKKQIQESLREVNSKLQDVQEKQMQIQETWHEIKIKKIEIETKINDSLEKLKELEVDTSSIDTYNIPEVDAEKVKIQIERLKKFIRNFGGVNLAAEEDYHELQERHVFMNQQIQDLQRAKESLLNVIKEYDRECVKRFKETFDRAGEEFSNIFTRLFEGGEARLELSEPDNLLDSGVDVTARPPGKKLRNLALLSGGEKAITAVAFLFAILKIKASPFVIMDELDAPLDDANIERVVELIKEFSKTTQFILVTHNKKTMEAAKALYGITMEEKGVSKIISVSLEEAA